MCSNEAATPPVPSFRTRANANANAIARPAEPEPEPEPDEQTAREGQNELEWRSARARGNTKTQPAAAKTGGSGKSSLSALFEAAAHSNRPTTALPRAPHQKASSRVESRPPHWDFFEWGRRACQVTSSEGVARG